MPTQGITQSTLPQAPIKPFNANAPSALAITPPAQPVVSPIQPQQTAQPNVSQATTQTGLDAGAVAVAQAIRQTESNGNFTAQGKSGEYGAYQWEPATWAAQSAAAGVNVPLQDATPAQQNQVAYTQIKKWKDQGYNVGQIASMWNAGEGDPNAYLNGNKGTNSSGVSYDTQAYAQKVATAYQQYKTQQPTQNGQTPATGANTAAQAPSLAGFGSNALSSAGNFVGNIINAAAHPLQTGQNILETAAGGFQELGGQNNDNTAKFDALKNYFGQKYLNQDGGAISPGSVVDAVANSIYKDPISVLADISTIFSGGATAAGLVGKVGEIAGLADAADTAGTVASGLNKAAEYTNPLTPVLKGTGALLSKGASVGKSLASQFTEISPEGMQDIYDHPENYTPEAITNNSRLNIAKQVETALNEREDSLSETGGGYKPIVEGTSESNGVTAGGKNAIPVEHDFLENQFRTVANLDVKDGKIIPTTVSKVGKAEVTKLQDVLDTFKPAFQSGFITPEEFLALRSRLADAAYNDSGIKNTKVAKLAEDVRNNLNTSYRGAIPGLEELDNSYSGQLAELKNLRKGFIDKEGNLTQTAISKIANAGNKDLDIQRLEQLVPGITRQLTALKVMEEIKSAGGIKVGAYTKSITEGGSLVAGVSSGSLPLVAGSIALTMLSSPKYVVPLIKFLGENKELIPHVMAQLAKYATMGSVASAIGSSTNLPTTQEGQNQSQGTTQVPTLPNNTTQGNQISQPPTQSPISLDSSDLTALANKVGFNLDAAQKAGYSEDDIRKYLQTIQQGS